MQRPLGSLRGRRLLAAGLLFAVFPVAWWLRSFILADRFALCLYRRAVHKPCPFCGLTRAFAHMTHGEFGEAWRQNPLWPLAAALIAMAAVLATIDGICGSDTIGRFGRALERLWIPAALALVAFGVWRFLA